jgi:hypothetical protein
MAKRASSKLAKEVDSVYDLGSMVLQPPMNSTNGRT